MSVSVARRPQDNSLASSQGSTSKLHREAQTHCSSLFAGTASIVVRGSEKGNQSLHQQDHINITDLPVRTSMSLKPFIIMLLLKLILLQVGVLLKIISYVDACSVCRLCMTCSYLNCISSDTLLWRRLLQRDIQTWKVIGHLSHPLIYHQTTSDLPPKMLYVTYCKYIK